MSRNDEPITTAAIWFAAEQTVRAHDGDGWCYSCTVDGCRQLAWAHEVQRGGPAAQPVSVVPVPLEGARWVGRNS